MYFAHNSNKKECEGIMRPYTVLFMSIVSVCLATCDLKLSDDDEVINTPGPAITLTVSGHVITYGQPVPGILIRLSYITDFHRKSLGSATTDANGHYSIQTQGVEGYTHSCTHFMYSVYISGDNDSYWQADNVANCATPQVVDFITRRAITSLAINSSGHVFAGTLYGGVFRSTDNGNSWTQSSTDLTFTHMDHLVVNSSGYIFAGTFNKGVYRSTDNGDNWTQINVGMTDTAVASLAVNSSGHIFAGTRYSGVYRSTDNGDNWTQINAGLTDRGIFSLAVNSNGHVFAGTDRGIYRSTDNGTNWVSINVGLTNDQKYVGPLAINSAGHIFAATDDYSISGLRVWGIFRSTDNGDSWISANWVNSNYSIYSLAINSSGTIFNACIDGVYRSVDNGGTWAKIHASKNAGSLAINSSGHIYSAAGYSVYRSTDNGLNWTDITAGIK